jgi:hypothetical protein
VRTSRSVSNTSSMAAFTVNAFSTIIVAHDTGEGRSYISRESSGFSKLRLRVRFQ